MLPLIEEHLAEIAAICRQYRVSRLRLFGSAARGEFVPASSDLDFFVEFEELGWKGSFKRYIHLKRDLEQLLDRPVDLVEPSSMNNPYFHEVANRNVEAVYATCIDHAIA